MSEPAPDPAAIRAEIDKNTELGEWELVAEDLVDLAGLSESPEEAVQHLLRAADVFEEHLEDPTAGAQVRIMVADMVADTLGDLEEAILQLEMAREADPHSPAVFEALEGLYAETEDWSSLLELYEQRLPHVETDERRVELLRKAAVLRSDVMGDVAGAAEVYARILELAPGDERAANALERLYRDGARWSALAGFYAAQAERAEEAAARVGLLLKAAEVQDRELDDTEASIATSRQALEAAGDDGALKAGPLGRLEELYAKGARWEDVVGVLEQRAEVSEDLDEQLDLYCRLGTITSRKLGKPQAAVPYYEQALTRKRDFVPAIDALLAVFLDGHQWDLASQTLALKLQAVKAPEAKSKVHLELARLLADQMGSTDFALGHLELAVELDPESRESLLALGLHYIGDEDWTKALPLLERAAPRLHKVRDQERLAEVKAAIGRCHEELLDYEAALEAYEESLRLVEPPADMLWRMAQLAYEHEEYADAQRYYQRLKQHHYEELDGEQQATLEINLSEAAAKLGQMTLAMRAARDAELLEPKDAASLERVIEVVSGSGDWAKVVELKQKLLEMKTEPADKYQLAVEIGDLFGERLVDELSAMDWYEQALGYGDFSKAPLVQLVQILIRRHDYHRAIEYLDKLSRMETDRTRRARWLMSIAGLYQDELKDPAQAVKAFDRVLDLDPWHLEAFQAVDSMLSQLGDWKSLERAYRKMLKRVVDTRTSDKPRTRKLLFMLWRNLGEIYRKKLGESDHAIHAYDRALEYEPNDLKTRLTVARLCVQTAGHLDEAIAHYRWLLSAHPDKYEHYHKLGALYASVGKLDRAWAIAGLLKFFGKSHEVEERMYEKYSAQGVAPASRGFDDQIWLAHVMADGTDPAIGQVFAILYAALGDTFANKSLKQYGLGKRDRVDLKQRTPFVVALQQTARILGLRVPDTYSSPDRAGLDILPTAPPVLAVGPRILASRSVKGLAFHLAKRLVYLHPWHILAGLYDEDILYVLFMAGATLVDPATQVFLPQDLSTVERDKRVRQIAELRARLDEKLTPQGRAQLANWLGQVKGRERPDVVRRWHQGVELTAIHAAIFVCNDVHLAARIVDGDKGGTSTISRDAKLKDVVKWVLSDDYAELRKAMGIAVSRGR